jgi:hypothetical protein
MKEDRRFLKFKKLKCRTDMCSKCYSFKITVETIEKLLQKKERNEDEEKEIEKLKEPAAILARHVKNIEINKERLKKQIETLRDGEAVIVADFSEKIRIRDREQRGHQFYNASFCMLFGAVIFYKENGKIRKIKCSVLSDILRQDSFCVISCLTKV